MPTNKFVIQLTLSSTIKEKTRQESISMYWMECFVMEEENISWNSIINLSYITITPFQCGMERLRATLLHFSQEIYLRTKSEKEGNIQSHKWYSLHIIFVEILNNCIDLKIFLSYMWE